MTGVVTMTRAATACAGRSSKSAAEAAQELNQLSLLDFILSALRKSMVSTCRVDRRDQDVISAVRHMEIGRPTNVRHITHVTFDRFHGFLGLPVEFEVEVPCRAPSASVSVFGVSAESMQCSYDARGKSVPTILLLMQERLYSQGGLKSEGIFRINPENSQEEHVRDELNRGIVPRDIDVHCLAGLIKAWFRELPSGVLDGLSPEQVSRCNTEEEEDSAELIHRLLRPTESALLSWAVHLMADVVEHERSNKMNARNIAMVFAPNMTQMADPLTALMHAVQVMNLLKTLIAKTLREREEAAGEEGYSPLSSLSSGRLTGDEYDSQQETDIGLESIGSGPDEDKRDSCSSHDKDRDDASDIAECSPRHAITNEHVKRRFPNELGGDSPVNADLDWSLSDGKIGSSFFSTSDGEDSRMSPVEASDSSSSTSTSTSTSTSNTI